MTQALNTLMEHVERQRNEALALLMQAEEVARRLQLQALQLVAYRDEYRMRQPGLGGRSVNIELLRSHHEFMQRLEQALLQQQGQMASAEERVAQRRAELLALETRVASVRKLIERRGNEERRRLARHEQRLSDDAAHNARRGESTRSPSWNATSDVLPLPH